MASRRQLNVRILSATGYHRTRPGLGGADKLAGYMLSRKMTRDASAQRLLRNRHRMFYRDHPPPHFHARYADYEAKFDIATLQVIQGALPPHGMRLVKEWAELHRAELAADWERAVNKLPLTPIEPLP